MVSSIRSTLTVAIILTVIFFTGIGCSPDACYEDIQSTVKATFFITGTSDNTGPDSIWVSGIGDDYPTIYSNAKGLKEISLPLNPSTTTVAFKIRINDITDTITFHYNSWPHLISAECGYSFFHTLEECYTTGNRIDTVLIRKPEITTSYEENIRIFY